MRHDEWMPQKSQSFHIGAERNKMMLPALNANARPGPGKVVWNPAKNVSKTQFSNNFNSIGIPVYTS